MTRELTGIPALVARTPGGPWYTLSTLAEKLNEELRKKGVVERRPSTIRGWIQSGRVTPKQYQMFLGDEELPKEERRFVWLYHGDDLPRFVAYAENTNPTGGRPVKH